MTRSHLHVSGDDLHCLAGPDVERGADDALIGLGVGPARGPVRLGGAGGYGELGDEAEAGVHLEGGAKQGHGGWDGDGLYNLVGVGGEELGYYSLRNVRGERFLKAKRS